MAKSSPGFWQTVGRLLVGGATFFTITGFGWGTAVYLYPKLDRLEAASTTQELLGAKAANDMLRKEIDGLKKDKVALESRLASIPPVVTDADWETTNRTSIELLADMIACRNVIGPVVSQTLTDAPKLMKPNFDLLLDKTRQYTKDELIDRMSKQMESVAEHEKLEGDLMAKMAGALATSWRRLDSRLSHYIGSLDGAKLLITVNKDGVDYYTLVKYPKLIVNATDGGMFRTDSPKMGS